MRSRRPGPEPADRCARAARRLEAEGLAGVRVSAEGSSGEIAAVRLPGALDEAVLARLDALERAIREIGFSYVALDLGESEGACSERRGEG